MKQHSLIPQLLQVYDDRHASDEFKTPSQAKRDACAAKPIHIPRRFKRGK